MADPPRLTGADIINDLTWQQREALRMVAKRGADVRRVSEPTRQQLIDLSMMEPALIDVDGDQISITAFGLRALEESTDGK